MLQQEELYQCLRTTKLLGDNATTKRIQTILSAENRQNTFIKLWNIQGSSSSGINKLLIPQTDSPSSSMPHVNWISLKMAQEIEEALQKCNQTHFGQAHRRFPTIPPFSEWVDWQASTYQAELILNGTFQQDELDMLSTSLLHHMKKQTDLHTIWSTIIINEWKNKIKVWKESTSTSPSRFHLMHSHALISPHDLPPDHNDYDDALETQCQETIEWQVCLLNTALTNAYSFKQWQHITNIILLKEPGNYQINCLHVIHIYEHDYNLIMAHKWCALIQHSIKNNLLHPSQYIRIPGRTSVTEFRQPLQVQSHLEMPRILVQLGHTQRT